MARMEDVLDLYQPEYNPERPVVCFDETSRQLTGEVRPPIEAAPGRVARYDTEYQRNGTRNLFMICEPKGGWRHVEVTERRTAVDFAHQMRWLVDEAYPDAEVVRLVLDNLNTHQLGSLYEAFEPCEARRIAQRLDRRQLVLPVATTIFAGRDGVIIRYGGTVDYRPTSEATEAETYGRQDTGNGSGQGWDERAFSAQVAEWAIAVAGETGASVAHSARSLRRGVGG